MFVVAEAHLPQSSLFQRRHACFKLSAFNGFLLHSRMPASSLTWKLLQVGLGLAT